MVPATVRQERHDFPADSHGIGTARMEMATQRGIARAGNVTVEDEALSLHPCIGHRNGCKKGFGIGVLGSAKNVGCGRKFHNPAQVHDGDTISDVLYNA